MKTGWHSVPRALIAEEKFRILVCYTAILYVNKGLAYIKLIIYGVKTLSFTNFLLKITYPFFAIFSDTLRT